MSIREETVLVFYFVLGNQHHTHTTVRFCKRENIYFGRRTASEAENGL